MAQPPTCQTQMQTVLVEWRRTGDAVALVELQRATNSTNSIPYPYAMFDPVRHG